MKVPDWSGHPRHVSSRIRCATILELRFNGSPRRGDAGALAWLDGSGPRSVMEPEDHWQFSVP